MSKSSTLEMAKKTGKRAKVKVTPAPAPARVELAKHVAPAAVKADGKKQYPPEGAVAPKAGRGRAKIVETLTPEALKAEIKGLLDDLKAATDTDSKKSIRRALRLRGHFGGLGVVQPKPAKSEPAAAPPKTAPKKGAAVEPDCDEDEDCEDDCDD